MSTDELNANLINRISLGDIFRRRAKDAADTLAVKAYSDGKQETISYKTLNDRLNQFVWALRSKGLGKGDKVAILGRNSIEFYIALLGCYKGGLVAVPINYLQAPDDLHYIIEHAECRAIYFDAELYPKLEHTLSTGRFVLTGTLHGTASEAHPALMTQICDQAYTEIDDIIIRDDDPAQIMYTSGTTSRPKGVVASHKSLFLSSITVFISSATPSHRTNQYVPLPLFHLTALSFSLASLHLGSTVSLTHGFDAEQALDIFEKDRIHLTVLAPMMWKAIAQSASLSKRDTSHFLCGFYGMAPMDQDTLDRLNTQFDCHFLMASGQTEVGGACTAQTPYWSTRKQGNYWGGGSVFCDQAIMDDEGNLLGPDEVGEIVWRSPSAMNAYFKNPEASREVSEYAWHHSGDLGFIDKDNQLCFVDRKKDIIKTGGENVSSVLVERTLLSHPDVANAAVIGLPHPHWGEALVAVVTQRHAVTEADLIAHCKQSLGGFQVPKRILFRDSIPTTATGKVQKPALREAYAPLFEA